MAEGFETQTLQQGSACLPVAEGEKGMGEAGEDGDGGLGRMGNFRG